jgi:hypothetical protein
MHVYGLLLQRCTDQDKLKLTHSLCQVCCLPGSLAAIELSLINTQFSVIITL